MAELFRAMCSGSDYDPRAIERIRAEQQAWAAQRRSGTLLAECADGRVLAVSHRLMADGGWLATYEDATEQRSAEARIRFMAHHDALTGLPNRVLFRDHIDGALQRVREGAGGLALLCLDLDHFKSVNDTLGHPVGDALLETAGQRLQSCVREGDIVARLGGDEFAIVQALSGAPGEVEALAERITSRLKAPYELSGRRVTAGVSIGVATALESGMSADLLLRNADMALYRAKASGRGTYRFFEPEMDAEVQARLAIEADLQQALERDQFEVFYQPLNSLETGRISGFEALLRWRHPERGLIPPAQFIPVAEELGLIGAIGEWVLRRACADAVAWPEEIKLAVNLSPMQFRGADVVPAVASALGASGLDPRRLELEITESALLQDNAGTLAMLHRLRGLGARIALDDFGTGYSSLSYLRSFPFDKIKVDRSFVGEMNARPDCEVIVNSIAVLASNLGMTTTAEGVENADQLDLVRKAGCTEGQGYHFGRPAPASEVLARLGALRGEVAVAA
jgi:diguanylate cyclase (GGDEF)-like protein